MCSFGTAATRQRTAMTSIDFWDDLDGDVLRCLAATRERLSPAEIGAQIGVSEAAARSILTMLAEQGKVRICSVSSMPERPPFAE
jgi:DNA-binding GntR family transcriptional regulator